MTTLHWGGGLWLLVINCKMTGKWRTGRIIRKICIMWHMSQLCHSSLLAEKWLVWIAYVTKLTEGREVRYIIGTEKQAEMKNFSPTNRWVCWNFLFATVRLSHHIIRRRPLAVQYIEGFRQRIPFQRRKKTASLPTMIRNVKSKLMCLFASAPTRRYRTQLAMNADVVPTVLLTMVLPKSRQQRRRSSLLQLPILSDAVWCRGKPFATDKGVDEQPIMDKHGVSWSRTFIGRGGNSQDSVFSSTATI